MPKLSKSYTLDITPEQFLNACSRNELIETGLLLDSPAFQRKINGNSDNSVEFLSITAHISETTKNT